MDRKTIGEQIELQMALMGDDILARLSCNINNQ
jgi:hypothetical protein